MCECIYVCMYIRCDKIRVRVSHLTSDVHPLRHTSLREQTSLFRRRGSIVWSKRGELVHEILVHTIQNSTLQYNSDEQTFCTMSPCQLRVTFLPSSPQSAGNDRSPTVCQSRKRTASPASQADQVTFKDIRTYIHIILITVGLPTHLRGLPTLPPLHKCLRKYIIR